jgi:hypothetical protein
MMSQVRYCILSHQFFVYASVSLLFVGLLLGELDGGGTVGCVVGDLTVGEKVGPLHARITLRD